MFPCDVYDLILRDLGVKDASWFSLTSKENSLLVKEQYKGTMDRILSLKKWSVTFPNARYAKILKSIHGDEFVYMSNVEHLDMSLCTQPSIKNDSFRHLQKLKHLNLQGACGSWIGGHHFTDKVFDYLSELESLYIDDNHVITDDGIQKLRKIRTLTIHNCRNIRTGISSLFTLRKLDLYNLQEVKDDAFKLLTGIEELSLSFMNVTDVAISYLVHLGKISIMSCDNIKGVGFEKLNKLDIVSITHGKIVDSDLVSLCNVKNLCLYGCNINGSGLKYLRTKVLTIHVSPIVDDYLNVDKDTHLNIYRCRLITLSKKRELSSLFGKKFNTD